MRDSLNKVSFATVLAFGVISPIGSAKAQAKAKANNAEAPSPQSRSSSHPHPKSPLDPPPSSRHSFNVDLLTGLRIAPIGLGLRTRLGYRYQLFRKDHPLFRDTYLGSRIVTDFAPTFALAGVEAFVQPLAILQFGLSYLAGRYFSTFGNLLTFPGPDGDYSPQNLDARRKTGEHYGANGQRLTLSLRLQAKVKQFVLRSKLGAQHDRIRLQGADRYFYDRINDVLKKNRGWTLVSHTDAFWNFRPQSYLGARLSLFQAYFGSTQVIKQEQSIRLGPALVLSLPALQKRLKSTPQLIFLSQWHLRHRYRSGAAQSQAIPTVTFAFRSQWEFPPRPRQP